MEYSKLINDHTLRAAKSIANNVFSRTLRRGRYIAREDLEQEASIGLIEAASKFDATRKNAFTTYAHPIIRGRVIDFLRRQDHLTRYQRQMIAKKQAAGEEIKPLDFPSIFPMQESKDKPRTQLQNELRELLLIGFTRRERLCVILHYFERLTMRETGNAIGISETRVSQILSRVQSILRERALKYLT